jgi:hypothetical protein
MGASELEAQVIVRCVGTASKNLPSTGEPILDDAVRLSALQSAGISHYRVLRIGLTHEA